MEGKPSRKVGENGPAVLVNREEEVSARTEC